MVKNSLQFLIAIDGPAGAGKGTIAKHLAQEASCMHIDSGLLYRSVGRAVIENDIDPTNEEMISNLCAQHVFDRLADPTLKCEKTASVASIASIHASVRAMVNAYLYDALKNLSSIYAGLIVDGRDIGTVVFPNADLKFFITADPNVRALRREKEIQSDKSLVDQMMQRDQRDQMRVTAPLQAAKDAFVIDTTTLNSKEACQKAYDIFQEFLEHVK
jgi:CMP/dCMP kinase